MDALLTAISADLSIVRFDHLLMDKASEFCTIVLGKI